MKTTRDIVPPCRTWVGSSLMGASGVMDHVLTPAWQVSPIAGRVLSLHRSRLRSCLILTILVSPRRPPSKRYSFLRLDRITCVLSVPSPACGEIYSCSSEDWQRKV